MGNKVRNFIVSNATVFLIIFNIVFFVFGIIMIVNVKEANTRMEAPEFPYFFRVNLNLQPVNDFIEFCGIALLIASLAGFVIVLLPQARRVLLLYMTLVLTLGFLQIIVGGYTNNRDCAEIEAQWFTTTGFYNRQRQDFKFYNKCCGFNVWNDDFVLDQDDLSYLADPRVKSTDTPGCYININDPNTETACGPVCNKKFKDETQAVVDSCIAVGVIQLLAGIVVVSMIWHEKKRQDPTTSDYYF